LDAWTLSLRLTVRRHTFLPRTAGHAGRAPPPSAYVAAALRRRRPRPYADRPGAQCRGARRSAQLGAIRRAGPCVAECLGTKTARTKSGTGRSWRLRWLAGWRQIRWHHCEPPIRGEFASLSALGASDCFT